MAPCSDPEADSIPLPGVPCPGEIRSNIEFLMLSLSAGGEEGYMGGTRAESWMLTGWGRGRCWGGRNFGSEGHKSHIAFSLDGSFQDNAKCPETVGSTGSARLTRTPRDAESAVEGLESAPLWRSLRFPRGLGAWEGLLSDLPATPSEKEVVRRPCRPAHRGE